MFTVVGDDIVRLQFKTYKRGVLVVAIMYLIVWAASNIWLEDDARIGSSMNNYAKFHATVGPVAAVATIIDYAFSSSK